MSALEDMTRREREVLELLCTDTSELSSSNVGRKLGCSRQVGYRALRALRTRGFVRNRGRGPDSQWLVRAAGLRAWKQLEPEPKPRPRATHGSTPENMTKRQMQALECICTEEGPASSRVGEVLGVAQVGAWRHLRKLQSWGFVELHDRHGGWHVTEAGRARYAQIEPVLRAWEAVDGAPPRGPSPLAEKWLAELGTRGLELEGGKVLPSRSTLLAKIDELTAELHDAQLGAFPKLPKPDEVTPQWMRDNQDKLRILLRVAHGFLGRGGPGGEIRVEPSAYALLLKISTHALDKACDDL